MTGAGRARTVSQGRSWTRRLPILPTGLGSRPLRVLWREVLAGEGDHQGYVTTDNYHWVCEPCFADFQGEWNGLSSTPARQP
jgi:hypothetical protein